MGEAARVSGASRDAGGAVGGAAGGIKVPGKRATVRTRSPLGYLA
jgi:hypothetical protein